MDPSHTKSLRKVKQKGDPEKINFLLRKEEKSLLQNIWFVLNELAHQSL